MTWKNQERSFNTSFITVEEDPCGSPGVDRTLVSRNVIRLFVVLEDSADLQSIELVANEVLAMQMPTTPAQLQNLTEEIRQKVGELGTVENILEQSTADIQRAEDLLERARTARWAYCYYYYYYCYCCYYYYFYYYCYYYYYYY